MIRSPESPKIVLAIGGSDCSAGAGIQADLKAIHDNGGYALTVVTGVVAETPHNVVSYETVSPKLIEQQILCLLDLFPVSAIKVGLLFTPEIVKVVSDAINNRGIPVVVDPVGAASSGTVFGGEAYRKALVELLFPLGRLITPNLPETCLFLGIEQATGIDLSELFSMRFQVPALIKGGHSETDEASDIYAVSGNVSDVFTSKRLEVPDLHGTGCTLASAIATYLACGSPIQEAISAGKFYMEKVMKGHFTWEGNIHALGNASDCA